MSQSIDNIGKISKLEYFVMFLAICISGNPLFIYAETKFLYVVMVILLFVMCAMHGKALINKHFRSWALGSILLFVLQYVFVELTSIAADLNFLARLYIAFLTASFLGYKFRETYLRVMILICAVSLVFFSINITTGIEFGIVVDRYYSILLYNSILGGTRNSGMFWEPGAFQGFIMLVPLLYSDNLTKLWKKYKMGCVVILLALLTTKSTTGYLTFAAFVFFTLFFNRKMNVVFKMVMIAFAIIAASYVWKQDFMGEKIIEQYEEAQELDVERGGKSWDRMGVMLIDLYNLSRHPIVGNGFVDDARYGVLGEYMKGAGNGLSGALNMFGIPFMFFYFFCLYKNQKYLQPHKKVIFLLIIAMVLFGEYFLNYPLLWSLLFIKVPCYEKNSSIINRT